MSCMSCLEASIPKLENTKCENKRDFCEYCGARIPCIEGEGTCEKCDPNFEEKVRANIERQMEIQRNLTTK